MGIGVSECQPGWQTPSLTWSVTPFASQERLGQALYRAEVNYQQVSDQLQGMQAKLDEAVGKHAHSRRRKALSDLFR